MLFQKICLEAVVLQIAEYADKEKKGQRLMVQTTRADL